MPGIESPGEVPGANVSDSQGTQVGSGNTMYNVWMLKPPLDLAAVRDLNPHTAVAWLQELEHRELVNFFARESPDGVSEILEVFAEVDLTTVVATLGDISRRKATELISAVDKDHFVALLGDLPEAAEAIARHAATLRWTDAGPLEAFTEGYARKHKNGHVFWSATFGMQTTVGAIDDCMTGDDVIPWGFPAGDQETAVPSPFGTEGIRQRFQFGIVYSSSHGAFRVIDERRYEEEGGTGGWLGFPIIEINSNFDFGGLQNFEGGSIYSYAEDGSSFTVRRGVLGDDMGWRPISDETYTVSSSGTRGAVQRFKFSRRTDSYETAIYCPEGGKPLVVAREAWSYYSNLGGEKSWLGFPAGRKWPLSSDGLELQDFEAGMIYWRPGANPVAVPIVPSELTKQEIELRGKLGFPLTEEQPVGDDGSGRIQYFENGVATLRDGKREIWLRPESSPRSPENLSAEAQNRVQRAEEALTGTVGTQLSQRKQMPPASLPPK